MSRFLRRLRLFLPVILVAATAVGCGSGGGASSTVPANAVALVGSRVVTVAELNHQIELRKVAAQVKKEKFPTPGSDAYKSDVIDPLVKALVQNAQVENIAADMHISVSSSEISDGVKQIVSQYFQGDQTKYKAYLAQYHLSEDDIVNQLIRPSLLQKKIVAKIEAETKVTDRQVQDYYNRNKAQYKLTAPSRNVHFVLVGSKSDADKAHTALAAGGDWTAIAKQYAIPPGPPGTGGTFEAKKGGVEVNFGNAVFGSLKTGQLSDPVLVDKAYAKQLAPNCKPSCYFLISPIADIQPAGVQQSFDQVKDQIRTQLESSLPQQHLAQRIAELKKQQDAITRYAPAYKPAPPPSTTAPSTSSP